MSIIEAVLLGLLQGLTEFLPVSSSGHLAIFQNLFHVANGTEDLFLFDIMLHIGTLISIFVAFHHDIFKMVIEGFGIIADAVKNIVHLIKKEQTIRIIHSAYRKFVMLVIVSTIPTGIIGILIKDIVKDASATLIMPGIFLLMTSALLFIADRANEGGKTPRAAKYRDAALIGIGQGFATLPGISRSGTTITACLLCGFEKRFAVRYSFIMSIPAVMGAAVLELSDAAGQKFDPMYLVGMIVAAISGFIAIKTMLVVVKKKKYIIFSVYCLIAGLVAIIGHFLTLNK